MPKTVFIWSYITRTIADPTVRSTLALAPLKRADWPEGGAGGKDDFYTRMARGERQRSLAVAASSVCCGFTSRSKEGQRGTAPPASAKYVAIGPLHTRNKPASKAQC